jgi:hypothetical protein
MLVLEDKVAEAIVPRSLQAIPAERAVSLDLWAATTCVEDATRLFVNIPFETRKRICRSTFNRGRLILFSR